MASIPPFDHQALLELAGMRMPFGKYSGRRLIDRELQYGYFVEPTIIDGLPVSHPLFSEELFVPITVIGPGLL